MSETKDDKNAAIYKDQRFAHLFKDPRFKNIKRSEQKVKIDKRFKSMFADDKFNVKYSSDKYGRRVNKTSSEDLKKYYHLSSSDDDDGEDDEDDADKQNDEAENAANKKSKSNSIKTQGKTSDEKIKITNELAKLKEETSDDDEYNDVQDDKIPEASDEEIAVPVKKKLADLSVDYARGKGVLLSDSSSDEETTDDEDNAELFIEHVWGELDAEAPRTDDSTHRLAACNMDWDRIRACDIMVLCSSFLPPGGSIVSVTIYPSEYGKERMAEEEVKGPMELTQKENVQSDDDNNDDDQLEPDGNENDEGNDYNMEKLRKYQLNRLKYYYAIIECDRVATADKLYQECDGLEYESTATKLDLRFIPDDMTFDDEPKDVCTALPDLAKYKPRLFTTTALQQAKVELTWDENNVDRRELNDKLMSGKINEVADHELRKYVAYSSDENGESEHTDDDNESDGEVQEIHTAVKNEEIKKGSKKSLNKFSKDNSNKNKDSISKYKALLQEIQSKEDKEKSNRIEMEYTWRIGGTGDSKTDEMNVNKNETSKELTHFDKILQFKKEKKQARKAEKKKLRKLYKDGGENVASVGTSDSDDDDLPDGIDLNDPYFAEEFASGDFHQHKSAKTNAKRTKQKKPIDEDPQKNAELELLLDDDDDGKEEFLQGKAHFSLKKIQDLENESKSKKKKSNLKRSKKQTEAEKALLHDDFELNVDDDRFKSVYSSHLYSIDPTNPNYKRTKGMERLVREKLKRRPGDNDNNDDDDGAVRKDGKKPKRDVAVSMLVKSLKRKIGQSDS